MLYRNTDPNLSVDRSWSQIQPISRIPADLSLELRITCVIASDCLFCCSRIRNQNLYLHHLIEEGSAYQPVRPLEQQRLGNNFSGCCNISDTCMHLPRSRAQCTLHRPRRLLAGCGANKAPGLGNAFCIFPTAVLINLCPLTDN